MPIIGLSMIESTGNNFAGLWYPVIIAGVCFVVGAFLLPETKNIDIAAGESTAGERTMPQVASAAK